MERPQVEKIHKATTDSIQNPSAFGAQQFDGRKELSSQESSKPWFTDVPHEEYVSTRLRLLRDESLGPEEKTEMVRVCDIQRASMLLSDDKQYQAYMRELSLSTVESALLEYVSKQVTDSFMKKGEYYNLPENSKVIIPKKFAVYGISGEITFDRVEVSNEGIRTYAFRINREKKKGFGEEEYTGLMQIDVTSGQAKTVVLPESIDLTNPSTYDKHDQSLAPLLALPFVALSSVSRVPKINPVPYQDGRMDGGENEYSDESTLLYEEITSTLLYRRCTIKPGQDVDRTVDELNRMIDKIPEAHKEILKQIGGGKIQLRVYFAYKDPVSGNKDVLKYEQSKILSSIAEVVRLIQEKDTFEQVVVIPNGSRIPRELDNLPPGPSPRHHTRRTRTKNIIVLSGDVPVEIRNIQAIISNGREVSEVQLQVMADFTGLDIESVREAWKNNHRRVSQNTIITADAKALPDSGSGTGIPHVYKRVY